VAGKDDTELDRLRGIYEQLNRGEKEEIVKLAEGLLDRQRTATGEKPGATGKAVDTENWGE